MDTLTHSIYFVFKPTSTYLSSNTRGNYVLSIQNGSRTQLNNSYPDIGIYRYIDSSVAIDGYLESSPSYLLAKNAADFFNGTSSSGVKTSIDILSVRLNGSTSVGKFSQMISNNRTLYFTQSTSGVNPGSSASITIGDRQSTVYTLSSSSTYPYIGYFCEFLFFDRYLSDTEDHQINEYLKKKWIG
jgi:hypothetical protein